MRFSFLLIPLFAIASMSSGAANTPKQPKDREEGKVLQLVSALEVNPLDQEAPAVRASLIRWAEATPNYTVMVCSDILGPIPEKDVPYGPELLAQQMFGNVAYQIKNPTVTDNFSFQMAGLESALRTYSVILASDPKARIPYFDNLLVKQKNGTLKTYMKPIVAKGCKD